MKLNLGCGLDYRKGWINVDFNSSVKTDVKTDFEKRLPFKTNSVNEVLLDNSLEHIKGFEKFLKELHRICKPKAIIRIYVPHYSGMYAFQHPTHYKYFGIKTFDSFLPDQGFNGERYYDFYFNIKKNRLLFFHHNLINVPLLSKLPINWMFNFGTMWQMLMERFQFFGFDEIYYELEVVK